jgi:cell division protein FtsQ
VQPLSAPPRSHATPYPARDPAPSRWAYRWHRLWLTPAFRLFVRAGLPVIVTVLIATAWLGDQDRRAAVIGLYKDIEGRFQNRPEFLVHFLSVEGASPLLAESIRRELGLELPVSSFDIDLATARVQVEAFDAVASAELRIVPGGVLQVAVTERLPAVLWRTRDGLWMLDAEGYRVAKITARGLRGDLPLIAGEGAERAVAEALGIIAAAEPIAARLRGLVRVGERRWDVVLDRNLRVMLPATDPVRALEHVLALDAAQSLLERDIVAVDIRLPHRPTIRRAPPPAEPAEYQTQSTNGGAASL